MIDLRSDTLTVPTDEMLESVLDADLGDEKRDGDPTVKKLESMVSADLGFDDAVYLPSGSMGNQIAARVHTTPGQEVLIDRWGHAFTSEKAGLAQLAQLQVRTFDAAGNGCPSVETLETVFDERAEWPGVGLLMLENTHNKRGGTAIDPETVGEVGRKATSLGMNVHLDGARLANAAVALDEDLSSFTEHVDSVMFDFSKGLGAPIGSVLAGDAEFIAKSRNHRDLLGGGWRQAGVIASMCIIAYENYDGVDEDHRNAKTFATRLDELTELDVLAPETNLILVNTESVGFTAERFLERCAENGVRGGKVTNDVVRFCTYRGISESDVEAAAETIANRVV